MGAKPSLNFNNILVGHVGIDDGPETCDKISVGGLTSAGWFGSGADTSTGVPISDKRRVIYVQHDEGFVIVQK